MRRCEIRPHNIGTLAVRTSAQYRRPRIVKCTNLLWTDLVVHVPLHADHDLFQIIHDGIAGTTMAPFGGQMTEEEIWHTMNYLKTLEQ